MTETMNVIFLGGPFDCDEHFFGDDICQEGTLFNVPDRVNPVVVHTYKMCERRMTETGTVYFEGHYVGQNTALIFKEDREIVDATNT